MRTRRRQERRVCMPPETGREVPERAVVRRELNGERLELAEVLVTRRGSRLVLSFPGPRRMLLEPGHRIADLAGDGLATELAAACGLTATEAVFTAPDGRRWLAQAVGPAWAGSEAAAGLLGTMFTSVDGKYERFEVRGSPLRSGDEDPERVDAELQELWRLERQSEEHASS